jgi:hypothetical protein
MTEAGPLRYPMLMNILMNVRGEVTWAAIGRRSARISSTFGSGAKIAPPSFTPIPPSFLSKL